MQRKKKKNGTQYFTMHLMEQLFWLRFHGLMPLRMCVFAVRMCPTGRHAIVCNVNIALLLLVIFGNIFIVICLHSLFYADRAKRSARARANTMES